MSLILSLVFCASAMAAPLRPPLDGAEIRLTSAQAHDIGMRIWRNEAGGKVEFLTHWNEGEDFGSFGIGHFIWYPKGANRTFTESFPGALEAIADSGETLPAWLRGHPHCPWRSFAAFDAARKRQDPRLKELRSLLARTVETQALYAAHRLENALPKILEASEPSERDRLRERFRRVAAAPNGVYALVDYVNFKGEGTNPAERVNGYGWGLLQVLELMKDSPAGQPSVESFEAAADAALTRRVANAPAARQEFERRWLPGWRARLKTYLIAPESTPK